MKHFIIITVLLISNIASAQANFEKGMQKAFDLWEANNWTESEQMFERIASAEPDEWLPNYYIAQMNSLKTWNEKDAQKVKLQLDKAQEYLNTAMGLDKDNADVLVMQAQIYTNWVAFDGMTYGMKYSAKVDELYSKASKLAPKNPMVVLGKAEWDMGGAKYFGKDTKPICKDVERAIELYADYQPESPLHPNWGKERAAQVLKSCKE
ncbi:MAG: hypothetical protein ACSHXF_15250 [Aquaticitalea sp.]